MGEGGGGDNAVGRIAGKGGAELRRLGGDLGVQRQEAAMRRI